MKALVHDEYGDTEKFIHMYTGVHFTGALTVH